MHIRILLPMKVIGPATTEIYYLQGSILSLQTFIVSVYGSFLTLIRF
jgi:hypothetical protein